MWHPPGRWNIKRWSIHARQPRDNGFPWENLPNEFARVPLECSSFTGSWAVTIRARGYNIRLALECQVSENFIYVVDPGHANSIGRSYACSYLLSKKTISCIYAEILWKSVLYYYIMNKPLLWEQFVGECTPFSLDRYGIILKTCPFNNKPFSKIICLKS